MFGKLYYYSLLLCDGEYCDTLLMRKMKLVNCHCISEAEGQMSKLDMYI